MSTYGFDRLFHPRSIALVGASERAGSLGRAMVENLLSAGYPHPVHLVNPRHRSIMGRPTTSRLSALDEAPDLVVIASPAATVPSVVEEAARIGAAAAVIVTAGLGHGPGSLAAAAHAAARQHGVRLLGPNCLGLILPGEHLNASFAARMPGRGDLALVSQSGAVAAGLIEWASSRSMGFSAVVSLGDQLDVDLGDCLDHFALDQHTRAILLYVESIAAARKFISAARAAARTKPVVVIKAGRFAPGARAAATHTGALAGSDAVYDAAFRRAGLLRVMGLDELFAAAETLGRVRPFDGNRLVVLTNGGGVGVLAVDELVALGGKLAELAPATLARLDALLPATWSRANPVDIVGDADAKRYQGALAALIEDEQNDAVLVMNVATKLAPPADAARAVTETARRLREGQARAKPVFAAWIGQGGEVSSIFEAAGIPHFSTEAAAVRGFVHLVRYAQTRDELMATPPGPSDDFTPDILGARNIVESALRDGDTWLDPMRTVGLLAAYGIPVAAAVHAADAAEAGRAAARLLADHAALAVKIFSPDVVHKSDVSGVCLNLTGETRVREAAAEMIERVRKLKPGARMRGVTIHPMLDRPKARELIAGIADDPVFGPVIVFGCGGTAVEVIDDKAIALPPLDLNLADGLIRRTRISRLLDAYRDVPAADRHSIASMLVRLAQLAADLPEVREVDLNPLLADHEGIIAVDARVAIAPSPVVKGPKGHPRFAIRPYPKEWEGELALDDGAKVVVRPMRPQDEELVRAFFPRVSLEDLRLRFFAPVRDPSHAFIARLTQIDYARAMAFVALDHRSGELLGVVRLHADASYEAGEYAVIVRSDLKGRGLGWALMQHLMAYARAEGLQRIHGQVLVENVTMLAMCRELGFSTASDPTDRTVMNVVLRLTP